MLKSDPLKLSLRKGEYTLGKWCAWYRYPQKSVACCVFWKWEKVLFERWQQTQESQIQQTENGYRYTENSSKNCSGGLAQLHLKNKSVEIYRTPEAGDCCHCRTLDLYISKLPSEAKDKDLFMYVPWKNQTTAHPHNMRGLHGTIASQSDVITLHKWYQKFANLQTSWVTR